jgi:alpha-L-fucosidase
MRANKIVIASLSLLICGVSCKSAPPVNPGEVPAGLGVVAPQDLPELDWWRASMQTRDQRLGWFREARFGMFVHWGVYSTLGGIWEGSPVEGYAEHIMRIKKISIDDYKNKVIAQFNPTEFDAEAWCGIAARAGMRYLVITAKHHDGFAMYDSDVSDYNVVKATPWHHDPMKDLKAACQRHGVHFGFYYSQSQDWTAAGGPGALWDHPRNLNLSLEDDKQWLAQNPGPAARMKAYVDGKAIPQITELMKKYDPEIIWYDTPGHMSVTENLRMLRATREAKPDVVVDSRVTQGVPYGPRDHFGDYLSTTDKPAEFPPNDGDWEAIPTTNESYGWHKADLTHKPASHFIGLLAKAAARGGNVLMNIGPMGTGKMDPKDLAILDGIAAWMKDNESSIRGTERTPLAVQSWGESTRKGNTLFLHVFEWPRKGHIVVGGLKSKVSRAYLLADPKKSPLKVSASPLDVTLEGPAAAPDAADTVIALELEGAPITDSARLIGTDLPVDSLRAFDGQIAGGLGYGAGKARDAYVQGWTRTDQTVTWPVRLLKPATFEVSIAYDADAKNAGGTFVVKLGGKELPGTVAATANAPVTLGRVTLPEGKQDIVVAGTKVEGGELIRLRGLILTSVKAN